MHPSRARHRTARTMFPSEKPARSNTMQFFSMRFSGRMCCRPISIWNTEKRCNYAQEPARTV